MKAPPTETWITPAYAQMHFDVFVSAGILAIITVGAPGTHGAGITGVHGIGVSTPSAAAVAVATAGLARLLHGPKGMMLTNGLLSMIVAICFFSALTPVGMSIRELGAIPNEHIKVAPITTGFDMLGRYLTGRRPCDHHVID